MLQQQKQDKDKDLLRKQRVGVVYDEEMLLHRSLVGSVANVTFMTLIVCIVRIAMYASKILIIIVSLLALKM